MRYTLKFEEAPDYGLTSGGILNAFVKEKEQWIDGVLGKYEAEQAEVEDGDIVVVDTDPFEGATKLTKGGCSIYFASYRIGNTVRKVSFCDSKLTWLFGEVPEELYYKKEVAS